MMMKFNKRAILCAACVSILVASLAVARPVLKRPAHIDSQDPMLALPSESRKQQQQQYIVASQTPTQEVYYVAYDGPQAAGEQQVVYERQVEPNVAEHESSVRQTSDAQQTLVLKTTQQPTQHEPSQPQEPSYQMVQVEHHQQQATPNVEQALSGDYPGEIIYVDQNGEMIASTQSTGSSGDHQHRREQNGQEQRQQSSGMAATILTEVPVRDMPREVLERLKHEYGVKVVATRERPGANLVINCDDYANHENSICNRQSVRTIPVHHQEPAGESLYRTEPSFVYPQPVMEHHRAHSQQLVAKQPHERPQTARQERRHVLRISHEIASVTRAADTEQIDPTATEGAVESESPRVGEYRTIVEEVHSQQQQQQPADQRENNSQETPCDDASTKLMQDPDNYGTRTTVSMTTTEEQQGPALDQNEASEQQQQHQAQADGAHQLEPANQHQTTSPMESGFDEQPFSNGQQIHHLAGTSEGQVYDSRTK